jgi:DNA repair photolyase
MRLAPIENPPNPWSSSTLEYLDEVPRSKLEVYADASRTIVARNDSPDVGFTYSVNPYRGCHHACAYCYARPSHEYLSFGAGTDFDTKIVAKLEAPRLLREVFERRSWEGALVMFSGVTDCFQPLEASLQLTRGCLEVCAEYRNPVAIVTKAPLVERDLDVLKILTRDASVHVNVSIPIWDESLARALEPGVATPRRRLATVRALARAGVSVGVMVAPFIPAVSEEGLAAILEGARDAGATTASFVLLRLPGPVKEVFESRLRAALPARAEKILHRLRETRGGALYDPRFGIRGRGEGHYAAAIDGLFWATARRLGLRPTLGPHARTFRRPLASGSQLSLFEPSL